MRRLAVLCAVSLLAVAGLTATPAQAGADRQQADAKGEKIHAAAGEPVTNASPGPLRHTHKAPRPPAFEASIVAEAPLRPTGAGRFRVMVARQRTVAVSDGVNLVVRLPRGVTARSVDAPGWRCRRVVGVHRLRCRHDKALRATKAPKSLMIHVAADRSVGTGRPDASVRVRWTADDGKREFESGSARAEILKGLHASITTTERTVKGTPVGGHAAGVSTTGSEHPHAMVLTGHISGDEGRPVAYQFRQLCTTRAAVRRDGCDARAEPVHWLSPTGPARASRDPHASFEVPSVSRNTPLLFEMQASGDGVEVSDTKRLVVEPRKIARLDPRPLAGNPMLQGADRSGAVGHRHKAGLGLRIVGGQHPLVIHAGKKVTLRASASARGSRYRWSTVSAPRGMLARASKGTQRLRFIAPDKAQDLIVGVTATDAKGRSSRRDRIVRVVPSKPATTPRSRHAPGTAATTITPGESPFCVAFGIVSSAPSDPVLGPVTLGGVTTTGTCTSDDATIGFTTVTIDGDVIDLSGTIDAKGNMTGTYTPSSTWGLAGVQISSISVTASLADDGSITGLTGTAVGSGVPFVSLPSGWSGTTDLTVTTSGVTVDTDASDGTTSTSGNVDLTGTINFDGTFSLAATAANLAVVTTADDGDATASGKGTITRATPGGPIEYKVEAGLTVDGTPDVQLFDNVTLSNGTATLDDTGIHVGGDLTIAAAGSDLDLDVTGDYRASTDYSLTVTQPEAWTSRGVSLSGLTGTLVDNGTLTFDVAGDVSDSELSGISDLSTADLTAQVANTCPPGGGGDASCKDTAVQLNLTLSAQVTLPGGTDTVPLQATATVDFATMGYSFDASMPGTFGPSELNLSELQLTLTDQPTAPTCDAGSAGGGGGGSGDGLQLGFSGQASVMGVTAAQVSGVFTGTSDYCLQVDLSTAGFNPDGSSGGTSSAFADATLIYSTTAMSVTAPGGPGEADQTVAVAKNSPTLIGTFATPDSLQNIFDHELPTSGAYSASVTVSGGTIDGFDGTADLELQQDGALLAGSRDGTSLTLDSIGVDVSYDTDQAQASLGISANGDFNTDGGGTAGQGGDDSHFVVTGQSTPIAGQINATLSKTGAGVTFDVGIDPTQTTGCPATASPCIKDAFGQSGLTVSTLSVGGGIQATDSGASPSLDVAADAVLPTAWTSSFGTDDTVPVSVDVQLSEANPCFKLTIGNPDGSEAVVSMVDGLFTADYAEVAIAPAGCTFHTPTGDVDIPAGSSLAFDGTILGDPIAFNAVMGVDNEGAPYVKATLQSAPIDFAGGAITVTAPSTGSDGALQGRSGHCRQEQASNDNSPAAGGPFVKIDTGDDGGAQMCGAIDVGDSALGGAGVTVSIAYDTNSQGVNQAHFDVQADLSPGGFTIADAIVQGQYTGGSAPSLDIRLDAYTNALGVEVTLIGQLDYEGGALDSADFGFDTNADIFGILGVNIGFDLAYTTNSTTHVGTTTFSYEAAASLFGWSLFHFGGTIFTTTGGWQSDGSPLPPPPPPPPPPVQISANRALDDGFVEVLSQLGFTDLDDTDPTGGQHAACNTNGCYYLYRDVAAPIAADGSIATAQGKPGGTPRGLLLVCYSSRANQIQAMNRLKAEEQQLIKERLPVPRGLDHLVEDPDIRSATNSPTDPSGSDPCVSLAATYNLDSAGNLYIASAGSFDWTDIKGLATQS